MKVTTSIKFDDNNKQEFETEVPNLAEAVETYGSDAAEYYYERGVIQRFSQVVRNSFDKEDSIEDKIQKAQAVASEFEPTIPQRGKSAVEKVRELLNELDEDERQALLNS